MSTADIEKVEEYVRRKSREELINSLLAIRSHAATAKAAIKAGVRLNGFSLSDVGWIEADLKEALKVVEEVRSTWE